jgi:hypothetical protein
MISSKNGVLYTIYDGRGRTIMVCRMTKRHTMMYIFRRYQDMSDSDKQKVRRLHAMAISVGAVIDSEDGDPRDIDGFLSFKEQKPCG